MVGWWSSGSSKRNNMDPVAIWDEIERFQEQRLATTAALHAAAHEKLLVQQFLQRVPLEALFFVLQSASDAGDAKKVPTDLCEENPCERNSSQCGGDYCIGQDHVRMYRSRAGQRCERGHVLRARGANACTWIKRSWTVRSKTLLCAADAAVHSRRPQAPRESCTFAISEPVDWALEEPTD
jgi:hypothetical protein